MLRFYYTVFSQIRQPHLLQIFSSAFFQNRLMKKVWYNWMKKGNCFEKYQSSGCMGGLGNSIDVLCGSSWKDDLSIGPFYVQFFSCCTSFDYPQLCKKNCYLILDGTGKIWYSNIRVKSAHAGVAQLVEQLICNQQVGGSNPSTSSIFSPAVQLNRGEFPSGQRGQTVNLLAPPSKVRILLHPLKCRCGSIGRAADL